MRIALIDLKISLEIKTSSDFDAIATESSDDIIEVESDLLDLLEISGLLSNEGVCSCGKLGQFLYFSRAI